MRVLARDVAKEMHANSEGGLEKLPLSPEGGRRSTFRERKTVQRNSPSIKHTYL